MELLCLCLSTDKEQLASEGIFAEKVTRYFGGKYFLLFLKYDNQHYLNIRKLKSLAQSF